MAFSKGMIFVVALIYGGLTYLTWSIFKIKEKQFTKKSLILPLYVAGPLLFLYFFLGLISTPTYTFMYYVLGSLLALMIYVVIFCGIHQIICHFTKKLTPIIRYIIILGIPAIIWIAGTICANVITHDEITLTYKGLNNKIKIAHLSDIHLGVLYKKNFIESIVSEINQIKPDVVVITGDLFDSSMPVEVDWLKPFDNLTIPIFYITGNHETYYNKTAALEVVNQTNIQYIQNVVEYRGINFIGVDYEYRNLTDRLVTLSPLFKDSKIPNVLLCHVPLLKPKDLAPFNIFLYLGGHSHGGQMFPMHLISYFGSKCFAGLYSDDNNHHVYVSTGLGAVLCPIRLFAPSVIGIINIEG